MSPSPKINEKAKLSAVAEVHKDAFMTPAKEIEGRKTEEMIFAFCGPLGSGPSTVARKLAEELESFNYRTNYIKVSDIIAKITSKSETVASKAIKDVANNKFESSAAEHINRRQIEGNYCRDEYGNDILALFSVKDIAFYRQKVIAPSRSDEGAELAKKSIRVVHIIDSLKHPDEVTLLRSVYGNMFYLFGILCAKPIRKNRLERIKKIPSADAEYLMKRDESEKFQYGQQLIETLQYSDFFIRNNHENVKNLEPVLKRYVQLLLGYPNITPTRDEYAMYMAQSAALRSACLSRQVGASIINKCGDLVATGCNDVPSPKGGLYTIDDKLDDMRCMNRYDGKCFASKYRDEIKQEIEDILTNELKDKSKSKQISELISKETRIKHLLEFSRSVHAEMDAIVSVARNGKCSLKDCILFCTTFPCHNCARHIIASGITHVYYIEPYEKSLTNELHDDAIVLDPTEEEFKANRKVVFSHFEGVAPRKYLDLFCYIFEKKEDGKMIKPKALTAFPKIPKFMDSYTDYESKAVSYLHDKIGIIEDERREADEQ